MKTLTAAVLALTLTGTAHADAIDDYINTEMTRQHIPGLALAIMQHGQLLRAQGYGFANLEHHVPVHPDTVFETGALGMQFTAVAVMLLVEDGKLRLDDPVRKYLPAAPKTWAPITLRQLLEHTSGLPTTPNGEFRVDYTDDELLGIIYKQELNFPAGRRWSFSYTGYLTLGMLIKKATGESYSDLLARRVFGPLGMHTTRLMDYLAIVPNRPPGDLFPGPSRSPGSDSRSTLRQHPRFRARSAGRGQNQPHPLRTQLWMAEVHVWHRV
jgi:CubicO group peptidase (beta-lactamase class C family)